MPTKKRFFKNTKKSFGNKSVNVREKTQDRKVAKRGEKKTLPKVEKQYFPNNSQTITEKPPVASASPDNLRRPWHFWVVRAGMLFVAVAVLAGCVILGKEFLSFYRVYVERNALEQEMKLWEDISAKYPTYRDADFQVAVLAYRVGDRVKEEEYIEKTLAIDPNYEPAKKLATQ